MGLDVARRSKRTLSCVGCCGSVMTADDQLDNFIEALNEEGAQEARVDAHENSFFDNMPDDETVVTRAREFDDLPKHWVRKKVWLKIAKDIQRAHNRGLRLLTLPGRHRFEVGLYAREGLLARVTDGEHERLAVVGFESDPTVFGLLATAQPPLLEMLRGDVLAALIEP